MTELVSKLKLSQKKVIQKIKRTRFEIINFCVVCLKQNSFQLLSVMTTEDKEIYLSVVVYISSDVKNNN